MSSIFGKFLTILGLKRREANILVVGLDNSGKSTILNYLKRKEDKVEEVVPTVGFTVERLSGVPRNKSGISLTAFDMSGQGRYRNLWEHYYHNVEGIIFVVDSTDLLRLVVARDELEMMLKHPDIPADLEAANGKLDDFDDDDDEDDDDDQDDGDEDGDGDDHNGDDGVKAGNINNDDDDGNGGKSKSKSSSSTSANRNSKNRNRKSLTTMTSMASKTTTITAAPKAKQTQSRMRTSSSAVSIGSTQNATFRRPDIPILFFANKMDLQDALSSVKISQLLGLHALPHKNWHIQVSNAISGEGIQDGIEWLIYQIAKNKKNNTTSNNHSAGNTNTTTTTNNNNNSNNSNNNNSNSGGNKEKMSSSTSFTGSFSSSNSASSK